MVDGVFVNDASSDIDVINGRSESVSNFSADEDDVASVLDDHSQDDKTPDGDSVSLLSENLRTAGDTASLDNFTGSLAAVSGSSDNAVAIDFDVEMNGAPAAEYLPPPASARSMVSLVSVASRGSDYNV